MCDIFKQEYEKYQQSIDNVLGEMLAKGSQSLQDKVYLAANYSLMAGGKRIRPVMLLSVAETLMSNSEAAIKLACAIEMIHTYSLIHDDLPCLDNDDLRRGKPTCHKVFGEATAVLAGDALLNRAYEIIFEVMTPELPGAAEAGRTISVSAGLRGMIAGQSMDVEAESHILDIASLSALHRHKTGALIKASIMSAAQLAQAEENVLEMLAGYADAIGLAFQIQDDILDVTADQQLLGKTVGKDLRDSKSTYVTLLGIEGARNKLKETDATARKYLTELEISGFNTLFLQGMTDFLLNRKY